MERIVLEECIIRLKEGFFPLHVSLRDGRTLPLQPKRDFGKNLQATGGIRSTVLIRVSGIGFAVRGIYGRRLGLGATSIGRSIAGNNKPLYDYLFAYNGDHSSCNKQEVDEEDKRSCKGLETES